MNKKGFLSTDPYSTLAILPARREPGTYDDIDALTDKYIEQGFSEDKALELAAERCEYFDENFDSDDIAWG